MIRNTSLLITLVVMSGCVLLSSGCRKEPQAGERVRVIMRRYSIDPPLIHVKAGEIVELEVTTADVQHGIDIPDLGIRKPVRPGSATTITFKAPAKGEYRVACGVICGPHHDDMVGKLVVE